MKRFLLAFVILGTLVYSCTDRDDVLTSVNIRIKNETNYNFKEVKIDTFELGFEDVSPAAYTPYNEYEVGLRYNKITIEADSANFSYQPLDSLLNDTLDFGFYTYGLSIDENGKLQSAFYVD